MNDAEELRDSIRDFIREVDDFNQSSDGPWPESLKKNYEMMKSKIEIMNSEEDSLAKNYEEILSKEIKQFLEIKKKT
eukprot:UN06911